MEYTMSFKQTHDVLAFINMFRSFYTTNWVSFKGTIFQLVFDKLNDFEQIVTSGVLDHPSNRGYAQAITKLIEIRNAIGNVLSSTYIVLDNNMLYSIENVHRILTPTLANYEGRFIRNARTGIIYKVQENGKLVQYSWDALRLEGNTRFITVTNQALFSTIQ